jgi:hypothetical protein
MHVRTQPIWPFSNRTALMNINSNDELATIVSRNNELFYKHFIKDWWTQSQTATPTWWWPWKHPP